MPSLAALKILTRPTSDYLAVPDRVAVNGMKVLAEGVDSGILIVCGESSMASVTVMLELSVGLITSRETKSSELWLSSAIWLRGSWGSIYL